jgi:Ca-activated chloride channel homolog
MSIRNILLLFVLLFALVACEAESDNTTSAPQEATQAPIQPTQRDGQTIVLVSSDTWWDGIYLPTYVMKSILEDDLGYTVRIANGDSVPEFFELVATGVADVFISAWFPTNDFSFDQFPSLVRVGRGYGGQARDAYEGWMASKTLVQQFDVDSINDLFDPNVISALDYDNDGKGEILGCPEAWACSQRHAEILEDYGLSVSYEMDTIPNEEAMLEAINQRIANNQPAVFYMYTPVAFPEEGTLEDIATWISGTEPYLPLAFNRGVTRSDFVATHPDIVHVMQNFSISGADVGQAMRRVADEGRSPDLLDQIADAWIAQNRDLVDSWLPPSPNAGALDTTWPVELPEDTLDLAYSQDKEDLFLELVTAYNLNREAGTPPIHPIPVEMDAMMQRINNGWYGAVSPDSSIWVSQIDRNWQEANPDALPLVSTIERYALSPMVIAMLEDRAEAIGYPQEKIGWADLTRIAQDDIGFRWSHASASTATGLLTLTAAFYAATDDTSGLTVADVEAEENLAFVTDIEATVNRYGAESEDRVITRNLAAGGRQLDAFVTQEQKVIFFNQNSPITRLVAIYPEEGTFWMDHPLILLDGDWVTDGQRRVFRAFADFVTASEQQQRVLAAGYRPADVSVPLDGAGSLLREDLNVNATEPQTLLQVPSPGVVESIQDAWLLTKRPADIVLVVDVSGSMEGDKLAGVKGALLSFIDQIESERDHVSLISFSSESQIVQPLGVLDAERMSASVRELQAGGGTMLYDAVADALRHLDEQEDSGRARVIVAMTDGQSEGDISTIENQLDASEETTIIYTVAYGEDADMVVLQRIAQIGEGQAYPSDPETISQLYELLAEYF